MKYRTDPANILRSVDIVFQVMAKASHRYDGLFPAVAERHNGQILMDFPLPPVIPGQRNSDRSPRGCNLTHDLPLLAALDGLDKALNRPRYQHQRTTYLRTFATECAPASPTGLLPWGEHAYWKLTDGSIGNSYLLQYAEQPLDAGIITHHQLSIMPLADWQVIHEANPNVLPRFVDGLDWHWMDDARTQFNRHAAITQFIRGYQNKRASKMSGKPLSEIKGSDFPGAAGVFIHDFATAITLVDKPDPTWKDALLRFSDSWWNRRLDSGLCPKSGSEDKLSWNGASLSQTLSHADSLLAAADALSSRQTPAEGIDVAALAGLLRERGESFIRAILDAEQPRLDEGYICTSLNPDGSAFSFSQPWAGNRGQPLAAKFALNLLTNAVRIGDDRGLAFAARAAEVYKTSMVPRDVIIRAGDPGSVIALVGELYRLTGDAAWLDAAMLHATDALELYFDCPLPRMSLGRNHYESQQGSSILVHALARLVMVAEGKPCVGGLEQAMA